MEPPATDQDLMLWRQFAEAATPKALCQNWLALQCRLLAGVRCAMVLLGEPDRGPFTPVAVWPDPRSPIQHLTAAAERALKERRGLMVAADPAAGNGGAAHIAYPIEVAGKIHGVVVLEAGPGEGHKVQAMMRQLHWGAAWLEVLVRRSEAVQAAEANAQVLKVLDLVTCAVEHDAFFEAAMALVTRMATSLSCERVSLGVADGKGAHVQVLSHSADVGKQSNLVRAIEAAMDEALDQRATVVFPLPPDQQPLVLRAHQALSIDCGASAILTIPLENKGGICGALTLERPGSEPFDDALVHVCQTAAALAGPILDNKRLEERLLLRKALDALAVQVRRLIGPGHVLRKLVTATLVVLVLFFAFFKVDYRVTAITSIEGVVQRVVAAPLDGYIREAPVRPGDVVRENQVLCLLDDRDLKLERVKWLTEKDQLAKQFNEAVAKQDRSQIQILRAKVKQAEAQLELIEEQIARIRIVAPFDGIVMSGDLSQSLGAPVERGQVLFEVAPLDAYRVIANVDEKDILNVAEGQSGELALPSMPGQPFAFVIEKITPVSIAKEGKNSFRVEGRMVVHSPQLRPGMDGVGKITVDRRRFIWVLTHEAIDWLRLLVWRWLP